MKIRELLEANTKKADAPKPRNFVAKNAKMGGAGQHKDKKKAAKQGDVKHKAKEVVETATAGGTSAGNVATGPAYKNVKGKTYKNKDGTTKNALDIKGANLLTGGSLKR